jgi:hypothetical protein
MTRITADLFLKLLRSIFILIIIFSIFTNSACPPSQLTGSDDRIIAEDKSDGIFTPGLKKFSTDNHNRTNGSANLIKPVEDSLFSNYTQLLIRKLFMFSIWSRSTFT